LAGEWAKAARVVLGKSQERYRGLRFAQSSTPPGNLGPRRTCVVRRVQARPRGVGAIADGYRPSGPATGWESILQPTTAGGIMRTPHTIRWLLVAALACLGCPADPSTPPEPAAAQAPTVVTPTNPEPAQPQNAARTAEPAEPAEAAAKPECSMPVDCAVRGKPAKGMAWACTEGKCAETRPSKGKKKAR
jgi:hypothetical protein